MKIFLIPIPLSAEGEAHLPAVVKETVTDLDTFFVENERTARRFISSVGHRKPIQELSFYTVDKNTTKARVKAYLEQLPEKVEAIGVLSEAGSPAIADPGALVVEVGHEQGAEVMPITGPSSILLALMGSGLNGQCFAFEGYLPINAAARKEAILQLEKISAKRQQTQLFIETPYRNNALMNDLISTLKPDTLLCVAADLTSKKQFIRTQRCKAWQRNKIDLHKKPTIFLLLAEAEIIGKGNVHHVRNKKNRQFKKSN